MSVSPEDLTLLQQLAAPWQTVVASTGHGELSFREPAGVEQHQLASYSPSMVLGNDMLHQLYAVLTAGETGRSTDAAGVPSASWTGDSQGGRGEGRDRGRKRSIKKFPCSKWLKQLKQEASISKSAAGCWDDGAGVVVKLQHEVETLRSQLQMKNFELETLKDALTTLLTTKDSSPPTHSHGTTKSSIVQ